MYIIRQKLLDMRWLPVFICSIEIGKKQKKLPKNHWSWIIPWLIILIWELKEVRLRLLLMPKAVTRKCWTMLIWVVLLKFWPFVMVCLARRWYNFSGRMMNVWTNSLKRVTTVYTTLTKVQELLCGILRLLILSFSLCLWECVLPKFTWFWQKRKHGWKIYRELSKHWISCVKNESREPKLYCRNLLPNVRWCRQSLMSAVRS